MAGRANGVEAPRGVTDAAIDKLKQMIATGDLAPGQRLPVEKDLAAQLGLSRTSLREAVRALSVMGVLHVRQGDGTYVGSLDSGSLMEAVGFVTELVQDQTVLELYEIRRLLEPAATANAAARISDAALGALGTCVQRMADSMHDVEAFVRADMEFHDIVMEAAGNAAMRTLTRSLAARTARLRVWHGFEAAGSLPRTLEQHRDIHAALVAHDPARARFTAEVHVADGESWLRETLAEAE